MHELIEEAIGFIEGYREEFFYGEQDSRWVESQVLVNELRSKSDILDRMEQTIEHMSDAIEELVTVLGNLLHSDDGDCAYAVAQKLWTSYQIPDDGRCTEDLS